MIVVSLLTMPCPSSSSSPCSCPHCVQAISYNAGVAGDVIVGKLLEQNDPRLGYDASTAKYVDMIKAGIIDPTKVVRTALQDAASVAALMTTTEAAVADLPEDKAAPAMPRGMGGMGGDMF